MKGWVKGPPSKEGWFRVVMGDVVEEYAYQFVHVYKDTDDSLTCSWVDGECELESAPIVWHWATPEPYYTMPYEQKKDRRGPSDLDTDLQVMDRAIKDGDLGLVWNMLGRTYVKEDDNQRIEYLIKDINLSTQNVHVNKCVIPKGLKEIVLTFSLAEKEEDRDAG